MRKNCYLHDHDGPFWPRPDQLEKDFLAPRGRLWASPNGNDHWGLGVEGLYGTDALPHRESVNVKLDMIGSPDHGVLLQYNKWDGRIQRRDCYVSKGDLSRLRRFMYSLHGDPYSLGVFIPFESAWKAVKEFIEKDGELPTSIEWVAAGALPPETFPAPTWPPQRLPG
ncbi:Imm1 family immunity protein [Bradyrhizobium sp.]|uniref:Imm1 family immunity protein n=1 Tax=Bradyrhizobium sp. TaxID=376 RepID=UPI002E06D3D9|nr:Imm1 family immunity protein [Bradyrhizobium sp.]